MLSLAACASDSTTGSSGDGTGASNMPGPAAGSPEEYAAQVQDRVFFDYDRYDLDSQDQQALSRQAAWLKLYPKYNVTVEGHCDERGTREYNFALGARRANAVRDYLVTLGVEPGRVRTISYGKERPVCSESVEGCWSQNRRGVTVLNTTAGS